jgi:YHS domain-containing protein
MTTHPAPKGGDELLTACGGRLDDPALAPAAVFEGKTIYFCHAACLRAFEHDPQRFMAGEIDHPAEDDPILEVK